MTGLQGWGIVAVGILVAAACGSVASAQNVNGPPLGMLSPPVPPPPTLNLERSAPGPEVAAPGALPGPSCSCGDRWGLARWRWHRAHCKRQLQEHFLGYLEEFNEWPLGNALYAHGRTQVANGKAAQMVFYHYDFVDGTAQLNFRGRDKLASIADVLPTSFAPVIVERTPKEPGVDEARRSTLLAELGRSPFPVPPERVVIGPPISFPIIGWEANAIFANQLRAIGSGGAIAGGISGIGGFVGGGLGFDAEGLSGSAVTAVPR
jgi:hypothetical protein